jgi:Flp pilus assembly protein CpaB
VFPHSRHQPANDERSDRADRPARIIAHKLPLPGTRAVLGGLLVGIAALGAFVTASGGMGGDSRGYLVATHDLAPGSRLTSNDLRIVQAPSNEPAQHTFRTRSSAEGLTLLGPVKAGELIQSGNVADKRSEPGIPEISFSIPSSRALGGDLRSGESVDVLVTGNANGSSPTTQSAVTGATVLDVDRGGSGITRGSDVTVVLAVHSDAEAKAVANAIDNGHITLVRTTGSPASPATIATTSTTATIATTPTTADSSGPGTGGAQ